MKQLNNNKKEKIFLRGAVRNGANCYLLANCQLLNYITWPSVFKQYSKKYKDEDIWAATMNFILKLSGPNDEAIRGYEGHGLAKKVVKFANTHRKATDKAGIWKIGQQQDANECLRYLFNMIVDLTFPKKKHFS